MEYVIAVVMFLVAIFAIFVIRMGFKDHDVGMIVLGWILAILMVSLGINVLFSANDVEVVQSEQSVNMEMDDVE